MDSLGWLRYLSHTQVIESSNLSPSIEFSVQISDRTDQNQTKCPKIKTEKINVKNLPERVSTRKILKDIYKRQQTLEYWIGRVKKELDDPDREDILIVVEHMQDKRKSALWIIRFVNILFILRKEIDKPYRFATKEDIRKILSSIENKGYANPTIQKDRVVLKSFYKIVYGNNEYYPEQVKWFSVDIAHDKRNEENSLNRSGYLEQDEVRKLIKCAQTIQNRAFLSCLYESGARPEEFLRLSNSDLQIDEDGIVLFLRGKTGQRRVKILLYAGLLQQWLEIHPLRDQKNYPLWVSESSNSKNDQLGIRGAEKIMEKTMCKAELIQNGKTLYLLRHSRATFLCRYFQQAEMCTFFGWKYGSKSAAKYIHLTGKHLDDKLIAISKGTGYNNKNSEYSVKIIKCSRCLEEISPASSFCSKCGLPVDLREQYLKNKDLKSEVETLRKEYHDFLNDINSKFSKITDLLISNPELQNIKTEILQRKIFR